MRPLADPMVDGAGSDADRIGPPGSGQSMTRPSGYGALRVRANRRPVIPQAATSGRLAVMEAGEWVIHSIHRVGRAAALSGRDTGPDGTAGHRIALIARKWD
jgi:hypothetical protein